MTQIPELDWIDQHTAHLTNRTGRVVFDVALKVEGKCTVEGKEGWHLNSDSLPDGEFIGIKKIEKAAGSNDDPPRLEVSWRREGTNEENHQNFALVYPNG